ncbi:MAG: ABC transporter substrate-binding protein [Methylobacteriaceae bacterium]|nr:ABC transporter substrate-binding protein [Methylobacteriaceae bacterium]MBV9247248.1 ABC transporter substrate-binding protein [Methylobacteriaceae bacterium]
MAENGNRIDRRTLLKAGTAAGAALATGPLFSPAVRAAAKTIKLGYVSPQTGPLAAFAAADQFTLSAFKDIVKDGIAVGGTKYPVEVVVKDSQSDPNRAATVAKELITNDKVDLMLVASTPETTNPVATQCEIEEVPCISTMAPWQPYFIGRQSNPGDPGTWKPFAYTYHYFWGLEDVIAVFTNMWSQLDTDKSVGGLFPNDGDGNAWGDPKVGFPPALSKLGFKLTDPGRYQNLTDDFTAQINAFKNAKAEIVTGVVLPPDFTTFWNQALQQGFRPKIASVGKAILFPVSVEALGKNGNNLSSEVWWSPAHPFKSSLTGQSAADIAAAYTKATGKQWTQPIGFIHSLFEVAVDVIKRSAAVGDPEATLKAIAETRLDTVVGPVRWNGENLPAFAQKNVTKTPLVGGQWRLAGDGKYDIVITDNRTAPQIPATAKMEPIG